MQARLRSPYVSSRRRESTKLCCDFAVHITAIIMMLITILLMIEDRCNTSFAKTACYVHMGKNKHVTEGHLTLFVNTFPNFSQSISNNHDFFFLMVHRLYHKLLIN